MERSNFTDIIVRGNALNFQEWIFCPGMLFGSPMKWWGDKGERDTIHEGLDLLLYRDNDGNVLSLAGNTKVPAVYDGTVVKVMDDFLGRSIFMEHGRNGNRKFVTVFGHTVPRGGIQAGSEVKEGETIAAIAAARDPKTKIAPHLHITAGWVPADFDYKDLKWATIGSSEIIKLIDPLDIIGGHAEQLEAGSTECNDLL